MKDPAQNLVFPLYIFTINYSHRSWIVSILMRFNYFFIINLNNIIKGIK